MSIAQLDLNLLQVLDVVLSERSVAKAARRLHVTPSAISNALARLRSALGDPLVVRVGRGIAPTPRAAALAPALKRALGDLAQAVETEAFDAASTTRHFTLAMADAGQIAKLPRLVKLVADAMPRARLRVVGIDTYLSSGGLAGPEVDVAVIGGDDRPPGVHLQPLYEEDSVLVARRANRRVGARATKRELARLEHVDVQVAPGRGYAQLARSYARAGIERTVVIVVPSFVAAAAIVAETDLVATLPASLVERLGDKMRLRVIAAPAPKVVTVIRLAWHERTHGDPAMRAFRDVVTKWGAEAKAS